MSHAVEGWLILVAVVVCCLVVVASARALTRNHVESIKRQGVEDRRRIADQFIARMDARRCQHQWRLDVPGWVCELCGAETLMPEGSAVERGTETET